MKYSFSYTNQDIGNFDDNGGINVHLSSTSKRLDFGPFLDSLPWNSLTKDDHRACNSVSPDGRGKISKYFKKKGKVSSKKILPTMSAKKIGNTFVKVAVKWIPEMTSRKTN
jgi:hypothetical protein